MPLDLHDSTPLYQQLADDLKAKIRSGALKVGDRIGSHAELSAEYGISLITVKKAVASLIQEGILFGRVGKGTYVARADAAPSLSAHKTIGVVLRDLHSPFFSRIMQSVEEAAYENGYSVLLSNSLGKAEKEEAQIRHFRSLGVKGLVIASMTHKSQPTQSMRSMLGEKFPFVMVSYIDEGTVPYVGTDHEHGGYLAGRHLIDSGYERIGFVNGEKGNRVGELRRRGLERALAESGRKLDPRDHFHLRLRGEWNDYQSGHEIGERLAAAGTRPDALFVYNDLAALGVEQALLEQKVKIPGDIAIIGFDNIERGQYARVPLTTVRQPTDLIGRRTVEALLQAIESGGALSRIILEPELIVRESCPAGTVLNESKRTAAKG